MKKDGLMFESDGCYFDLAIEFEAQWAATNELFIVADLETTGPDAEFDEVLEFAAILVDAFGSVISEFSMLVRITQSVPEFITELTGITQSDVDLDGRPLGEAMSAFLDFIGSRPIFIHHASFDEAFLFKVAKQSHQSFNNIVYDTLSISMLTWPSIDSHRIEALAEHVGATNLTILRALDYAQMTLAVLLAAREQIPTEGIE
jgi:DNA polymerase-3 subunit epsilon